MPTSGEVDFKGGTMVSVGIISPYQQVTGGRRLLADLRLNLSNPEFNQLRIVVAYAKSGPLLRLQDAFKAWREAGKRTYAIFGIDQQGTSQDALELALQLFDEVYVTREKGVTFHPKAYIFEGAGLARFLIGSNNLTVGGTETNFEATVIVDVNPGAEAALHGQLSALWDELLPATCLATQVLTQATLNQLVADGHVLSEAALGTQRSTTSGTVSPVVKSGLHRAPPTPLPVATRPRAPRAALGAAPPGPAAPVPGPTPKMGSASGFAIQIKPHHNGEIFLSLTAAQQNPAFFDFPFNGLTVPKIAGGAPYPQRLPDPKVNIQVYGAGGMLVHSDTAFDLNTVYYERNREIRITASQLVPVVPDYSVMLMRISQQNGIAYEIEIHRPDSPDYPLWVAACNQQMPSGGKVPRRYGWF